MRQRDYGSKEKLFSIDKNILWGIESENLAIDLANASAVLGCRAGPQARERAMTAIHGYIKPNRRPGELGIHSVDHFHFAVPDLAVAQNFYRRIRPRCRAARQPADALPPSRSPTSGERSARGRARNSAMSRSARSRTTSSVSRSACRTWASSGSTRRPASSSNGLWFRDHDGILVEIKVAAKSSPDEKTRFGR